ncbi:MAG TPA: hypothetical protein VFN29_03640 [Chiayiivirga sp.]|nr:hypothetical protein [Chiayiivirga sp.]
MRCHTTVFFAWALVALGASPVLAQSDPHAAHADHVAHAQHMQDAAEAKPAAGSLWATDAPLRQGMRHLREATTVLEHYEMGHLDNSQRDAAVSKIDAAIADMFANCKLDAQADVALHELLAKFMAGAKAARDGAFTKVELAAMQGALVKYPSLFDDAEWNVAGH